MYSEWASLHREIQCDKANQSVLHKFPEFAGKEIACSVVKHLAKTFSTPSSNADLQDDKDVKWTMEVLCFGLSLPLTEHEAIRDCVNIYCDWLTALTTPLESVPKPIIENPNLYSREIIHHLLNLFVPRDGSSVDLVKRQSALCQRVLRSIENVALESALLTRDTWETLLKFLLAANDSLLAPPAEKADIAEHLCERVLSVLFEIWILACARCFPSPSLWKTFRNMCICWRHHDALIQQWHRVNHALLSRLLKFMYGPDYPELQIPEEDLHLIPAEMTNDCIAQSWFRFLHILQNPVDLCHPEIISKTQKFMEMVLASKNVIDPSEHECLKSLPLIFCHSMHGISVMVNAFLGIAQSTKELANSSNASNTRANPACTPPGQRKTPMRPFSAVTVPLTQKGSSKSSSTSSNLYKAASSPTPMIGPAQLLLDSSLTMAPSRPRCNSILHLFGAWLFEAALAGVTLHPCHSETAQKPDRRANSFTESRHSSMVTEHYSEKARIAVNTYEDGRAEACGTLCRIFCAHRTGEDILPVYYSRFYITMYYGLQAGENMSSQVLSSILFNSCDLLRVDLAGAQILVPYILNALELVISEFKCITRETIPEVDLRKACFHLLLSMLCLPLHFKDLEIKDILSSPETGDKKISFISLKRKITELLLRALFSEVDATNTQMLLGGLMLLVQDLALYEEAEYLAVQPQQQDICLNDSDMSSDYSKSSNTSSSTETSYTDSLPKIPPSQLNGFDDNRNSRTFMGLKNLPGSGSSIYTYFKCELKDNTDTAHGLFGHATSLVCNRLMASWKSDLNTALAAMELLSGLAKVKVKPPNTSMSKRTVKWICDFIVYQCSRPATSHSRDLHSMIVAAFKCLKLWLVEHSCLLYDKECLHNVLEVVELGISGSKSQHRATDIPKYKGEKQLKPASMRVKDAAEEVLTCIIDQVGAFPPPCGPESLFSLLDEQALLKYARGTSLPEHGSPFRYFVLENSIILGLLEQPLGNVQDPLPTVTALIRGPFGRHAWTMQLRHQPRSQDNASNLAEVQRPQPMENIGFKHNVKHRYFPEIVETIVPTKLEMSIPTMESIVTEKTAAELDVLRQLIDTQVAFENKVAEQYSEKLKNQVHPNPITECKPPKICHEFQTARLFLSHYGFLSLEALKESSNSSLPPALVLLASNNSALFTDLETLDGIPSRDSDTVHVFYMKPGQKAPEEILRNVLSNTNVQPQFLEFLRSLGWPVFVRKHAGWTGHVSTSWKVINEDDIHDYDSPTNTGGSIYGGRQQVLYWADVSSEIAFVVPSTDSCMNNRSSTGPNDQSLEKNNISNVGERISIGPDLNLTKPKSLGLVGDKNGKEKESPGSPPEIPVIRGKKYGRHSSLAIGPDTRVYVVCFKNYQKNISIICFFFFVFHCFSLSLFLSPFSLSLFLSPFSLSLFLSPFSLSLFLSPFSLSLFLSPFSFPFFFPFFLSFFFPFFSFLFSFPFSLSLFSFSFFSFPFSFSFFSFPFSFSFFSFPFSFSFFSFPFSFSFFSFPFSFSFSLSFFSFFFSFPFFFLSLFSFLFLSPFLFPFFFLLFFLFPFSFSFFSSLSLVFFSSSSRSTEMLSYTNTGLEQHANSGGSTGSSITRTQEIYVIFIHALQNGLFRVRMQGQSKRVSMAIPLVDGMVVSRRSLGTLVRQTAINICRRKRLESELYQPPHVRRKLKIQDIVNKYRSKMTAPEFYAAIFQDVLK
ncbi:Ral GTPase-activating protein subunit beta [Acanthosepion pharaonis]|uniref:Ral GTPase-activating protein subunit beta n=1 Tax=Acanthosepion pharaonis TaxID=158019 RepID=A0A812B075_ACAPH|nr:Ral GTPase-activating protein subunit beta [Sepia pharaonis]